MIRKPKTVKPIAASEKFQRPQILSMVDEVEVFNALWAAKPGLQAVICAEPNHEAARERVESLLFTGSAVFMTARNERGLQLVATHGGIGADWDDLHGHRRGIVSWQAIVEQAIYLRGVPSATAEPAGAIPAAAGNGDQADFRNDKKEKRGIEGAAGPSSPKASETRRRKIGQILSTTSPKGIRELDPDALTAAEEKAVDQLAAELEAAGIGETIDTRPLQLGSIEANPWQPRLDWEHAELDRLEADLARDGLLHAILVRPKPGSPGRFQIADGERRFRAATALGWAGIRCEVRTLTDEQMIDFAGQANKHVPLNPMEEARHFARLRKECGWTLERLAASYDSSSGQVSNRMRLLKLPAKFQELVATGKLPPTHARALVPFADVEAVVDRVEKFLKRQPDPTLGAFESEIAWGAHAASEDLEGNVWSAKHNRNIAIFTPNERDRELLDVRLVPGEWNDDPAGLRAFNVKLWKKLQAAHEAAYQPPKEKGARSSKSSAAKLSPAEAKRESEQQARQRRDQFARRLQEWKMIWLRREIWLEIERRRFDPRIWEKLALFFMLEGTGGSYCSDDLRAAAAEVDKRLGRAPNWDLLGQVDIARMMELQRELVRIWLRYDDEKGPSKEFPDRHLAALAADLEVDLLAAWQHDLAGPLTEAYFNLRTKDELVGLAKELGAYVDATKPKSVMVSMLIASRQTKSRLPAELAGPRKTTKANRKGAKVAKVKK